MKRFILFLIPLCINFIFSLCSFAQNNTTEEIMTFETYYPAPFGVYNEMRAKMMAVGNTYYNGSLYCWSGSCSNLINATADLVVEGNVGIGTTTPSEKLNVYGNITFGAPASDAVLSATRPNLFIRNTASIILHVDSDNDGSGDIIFQKGFYSVGGMGAPDDIKELMRIANSGKVEIVNTFSGARTTGLVLRNDAVATNTAVSLDFTPNVNIPLARITANRTNSGGAGYTNLEFSTYNGDSTLPTKMTIIPSGNVGIGTVYPDAKLDIRNEVGDGIVFGTPDVRRWKLELSAGGALDIRDVTGSYTVARFAGNWSTGTIYLVPKDNISITTTAAMTVPNPAYKLHVDGAVYATGGYGGPPSDLRFKQNIMAINNPLDKILSLKAISFEWKKEEYKEKNFPQGRHYGVIGQEIEKVLPEIVNLDQDGSRNVNYQEMIPVLIEAVKEQQAQIYALGEELKELKRK